MSSPETSAGRPTAWLALLPIAVAVAAHAVTIGSGLVLDDQVLVERSSELQSIAPGQRFVDSYLPPDRLDPGYRPLTYWTFALETVLGWPPWARHAHNVALHALAAALVFLVLRGLLGDSALAAAGASLFAALPIGVDAVARIHGRAELLAGLAVLGIWWLALEETRAGPGGRIPRAAIVAALSIAGVFAHELALWIAPILVIATSLILGRKVPWLQVGAAVSGLLGYLSISALVLEGRPVLISPARNPLAELSLGARAFYGSAMLGDYLAVTLLPINLSAEYTRLDLTLPPGAGWTAGVGLLLVIAGIVAGVVLLRNRAPAAALAVVFYVLVLLPHLNLFALSRTAFAERSGYAAAAAIPLLLCSLAAFRPGARRRRLVLGALALFVLLLAARTVARGRDWLLQGDDPTRLTRGAPDTARAQELFLSLESQLSLSGVLERRRALLEKAAQVAERALASDPRGGWGDALRGHILFEGNRDYPGVIAALTQAEASLAAGSQPVAEPLLYKLRGNALLYTGKAREALADFERNLELSRSLGRRPDPVVLARRGTSRGQQGDLQGAMADFNAALAERPELPELWNNRGFCHFKLGDIAGAVNDYGQGYLKCVTRGEIYLPPPNDSQHAFLLKLADIFERIAAGTVRPNFAITPQAAVSKAAFYREEAANLLPSSSPHK